MLERNGADGVDLWTIKKPNGTLTVRLKNSFIITKTKNLLIRSPLQAIGGKVRFFSKNSNSTDLNNPAFVSIMYADKPDGQ